MNPDAKYVPSYEAFLYAVERMRNAQQEYSKRKSKENRKAARTWAGVVDEYIQDKREQLDRQMQPPCDARRTA
jgi:hypothetical protein